MGCEERKQLCLERMCVKVRPYGRRKRLAEQFRNSLCRGAVMILVERVGKEVLHSRRPVLARHRLRGRHVFVVRPDRQSLLRGFLGGHQWYFSHAYLSAWRGYSEWRW